VIEVGDSRVSVEDYWRAYDRAHELYRDVYGERFDDKMREALKEQVLEGMVDEIVLLESARKAGITVSDRELEDAITHESAFTRDGKFSSEVYQRTLELNRLTPAIYEAAKRRELTVQKMKRLVEDPVDFSADELRGLEGADEKLLDALRAQVVDSKKKAALKSYIEGAKGGLDVKVNRQLVS
jgi:peptidyl-prolyl cis-trans isomerase D